MGIFIMEFTARESRNRFCIILECSSSDTGSVKKATTSKVFFFFYVFVFIRWDHTIVFCIDKISVKMGKKLDKMAHI